ncbi:MAG: hypothetical protein V5A34_00915 [Halapricum sp.]
MDEDTVAPGDFTCGERCGSEPRDFEKARLFDRDLVINGDSRDGQ